MGGPGSASRPAGDGCSTSSGASRSQATPRPTSTRHFPASPLATGAEMVGRLVARWTFPAAALAFVAAAVPARAQVIEIDSSGQAQTYDGPTVFTGAEAV